MLTIEKATQLLNIAFSEYPSLKDEKINIKFNIPFTKDFLYTIGNRKCKRLHKRYKTCHSHQN